MVKKETTIHPTDMTPGPPVERPYSNSVVMPVIILYEQSVGIIYNTYSKVFVQNETRYSQRFYYRLRSMLQDAIPNRTVGLGHFAVDAQ